MSTNQHLDDGTYLEDFVQNHQLEETVSELEYEEERWKVVESKGDDFIALVDEKDDYETLSYENKDHLEEALEEGDEARGRYPSTPTENGDMIYDRVESAFIISSEAKNLEDTR